jgi:hypothetical protein
MRYVQTPRPPPLLSNHRDDAIRISALITQLPICTICTMSRELALLQSTPLLLLLFTKIPPTAHPSARKPQHRNIASPLSHRSKPGHPMCKGRGWPPPLAASAGKVLGPKRLGTAGKVFAVITLLLPPRPKAKLSLSRRMANVTTMADWYLLATCQTTAESQEVC